MLFGMEPPLKPIDGILALLMIRGQATEPVEPAALAVLAQAEQSAHDELSHHWCQTRLQGCNPEGVVDLSRNRQQPPIQLYPSKQQYREPITLDFGGFDFVTHAPNGTRVAIEWETGNISSSHRNMNKLAIPARGRLPPCG